MLGPSLTARAWYRGPSIVRDHRLASTYVAPPAASPVRYVEADDDDRGARYERDHRAPRDYEGVPVRPLPSLTGPTWDCHNWDPSTEPTSVCAAYGSSRFAVSPAAGPGLLLGVRDAAVPDHQYITVGPGRAFHELFIEGNGCETAITQIGIRFTDGTGQIAAIGGLRTGELREIHLNGAHAIDQIVLSTPAGARGTYTVRAR
jgi:hypothetical protein